VSTNDQLQKILAGCEISGVTDETYEDVRLHKDIGVGKYIHKYIVKPIANYGSSRVLRRVILKAVGNTEGKTVLDVSIGDDTTVLAIADEAKKVYANDISIHAMVPVIQAHTQDNIAFSHENLWDLKIPKCDVVICKNTLHHLNSVTQIQKTLMKLKRLGKKIVIMDVEDPKLTARARAWNAYYVFMLKDQGGFFISYDQFKQILDTVYKSMNVKTGKIKTIKGNYMLAVIE